VTQRADGAALACALGAQPRHALWRSPARTRAPRAVFAARCGARVVYAVEASALAEHTRAVVAANGLASVITVLQGKMEDVTLPEQVDVIVSEWMGYALFYEAMIGSVIHARDAWLRPGGLMLPSHATLWCAPLTDEARYEEASGFWEDVYGIDMRALAPLAQRCAFAEPLVESFPPAGILSWPVPLRRIDMASVTAAEVLPWEGPFRAASMGRSPCHGIAVWFDVEFHNSASAAAAAAAAAGAPPPPLGVGAPVRAATGEAAPRVRLATGPEDPATHWMTTLLYLDAPLAVQQDAAVCGTLRMEAHPSNERFLSLRLRVECDGAAQEKSFEMV
jgi:protein arginine N-methyltransferase 6